MSRVQTVVAESELQRALDCGELIRLYQPVIDLASGQPVQVEALLRWDHPGRGLLAPGEFLVDEDDSSLLVRIGWSVVIEAARRSGAWRRAFPNRPITVAVNLFDDHLARRDLPNRIEHLLHTTRFRHRARWRSKWESTTSSRSARRRATASRCCTTSAST